MIVKKDNNYNDFDNEDDDNKDEQFYDDETILITMERIRIIE